MQQGTGAIGAVALLIIFLFISFVVFIIKLSLDLRAQPKHKIHTQEEDNKHKKPPQRGEPKKEVMYLVEKPQSRNSRREKEYSLVSPKNIYMIDKDR